HTPEFLTINPNGKIPAIALSDGRILWESHAILYYFAKGTQWFPDDLWEASNMLKWMGFEQYSLEPYIGTSRFWRSYIKQPEEFADDLERCRKPGIHALKVLDDHFQTHDFAGIRPTIADIALYGYTHVAHEGGFDLGPHIQRWITRLQSDYDIVPMEPLEE
ncbi:MAG: glutathione S-transferase family protein, partial [Pseudomonadota bacterium]